MPITRDVMHSALGVSEGYQVPSALLSSMLDNDRREALCACIADATDDMSHDGMTAYFQDEQGDRDALKQDFTPTAVCDLVAAMADDADAYLDVYPIISSSAHGAAMQWHDRQTLEVAVTHAKVIRERRRLQNHDRTCGCCNRTFKPEYPQQRTCRACLDAGLRARRRENSGV